MDKISRILPSSPRINSTDVGDSHPFRPGAPSFGNPEGISSLTDRITRSAVEPSQQIHQKLATWKTKDEQRAAIAKNVSDGFFMNKKEKAPSAVNALTDRALDTAEHLQKASSAPQSVLGRTYASQSVLDESPALERSSALSSMSFNQDPFDSDEFGGSAVSSIASYDEPVVYTKGNLLSLKA
jgi:hypothetical protein